MSKRMAMIWLMAFSSSLLWAQAAPAPQAPAANAPAAHPAATAHPHRAKAKKQKAAKAAEPPAATVVAPSKPEEPMAPEPPRTLAASAPVKPSVTMQNGLLTIDAPNCTLSDVLSGVHQATGAAVEGRPPQDRVAIKLGPGRPEQVIAALLRGTSYDYVILGAPDNAGVITRILINSSEGGRGEAGRPAQRQTQAQPQSDEQQPLPEGVQAADSDPEPEPVRPPEPQPQPPQQRTPEQLFRELQQQQNLPPGTRLEQPQPQPE